MLTVFRWVWFGIAVVGVLNQRTPEFILLCIVMSHMYHLETLIGANNGTELKKKS